MNNKILAICATLLLLTSCSNGPNNNEKQPVFKGKMLLNGFNNIDDMYLAQQKFTFFNRDLNCRWEINEDTQYIKEGEGSLHIIYRENFEHALFQPIIQRLDISPLSECDVSDINKMSAWIYNDNDVDTKVDMIIYNKDEDVISSSTYTLKSKEYTYVEEDFSKLLLEKSAVSVLGFGLGLNYLEAASYYVDDWQIEFGAQYNEDDEKYLNVVDELIDEIEKLPLEKDVNFSTDKSLFSTLENLAKRIYALPVVYQSSVNNMSLLEDLLDAYIETIVLEDSINSSFVAYHFSKAIGLRQIEANPNYIGVTFEHSDKALKEGDTGSIKITFAGNNAWNYINLPALVNPASYSYAEMTVYNPSNSRVGLFFAWSDLLLVEPKETKTIKVDISTCRTLVADNLEMELTEIDSKGNGGNIFLGDIYISDITFIR